MSTPTRLGAPPHNYLGGVRVGGYATGPSWCKRHTLPVVNSRCPREFLFTPLGCDNMSLLGNQ
jgi:hypothetical protein